MIEGTTVALNKIYPKNHANAIFRYEMKLYKSFQTISCKFIKIICHLYFPLPEPLVVFALVFARPLPRPLPLPVIDDDIQALGWCRNVSNKIFFLVFLKLVVFDSCIKTVKLNFEAIIKLPYIMARKREINNTSRSKNVVVRVIL